MGRLVQVGEDVRFSSQVKVQQCEERPVNSSYKSGQILTVAASAALSPGLLLFCIQQQYDIEKVFSY